MKGIKSLPESYVKAFDVDLQKNKRLAILVNGLALLIGVVMTVIGIFLVPISELFSLDDGFFAYILRFLSIIVGSVAYIVLHELVHGIFMKLFSKMKVKYGFTGLYAYAGSEAYFDKSSYIIIALAPIVVWGAVLAVLCAVSSGPWFWVVYIIQIINISGAAGDIYVTCKFIRLPKDILIQDSGVAMTVYHKK